MMDSNLYIIYDKYRLNHFFTKKSIPQIFIHFEEIKSKNQPEILVTMKAYNNRDKMKIK